MNPNGERFRRSPQQDEVIAALIKRNAKVAEWFVAALNQLALDTTPARFCAAGNFIRLVLNELPQFFALPKLVTLPTLQARLERLEEPWRAACDGQCRAADWTGEVDEPVRNFLVEYEKFVTERTNSRAKQEIAGEALRLSDPGQVAIPSEIVDLLAERWIILHKYFNAIAHGSRERIDEFEQNLGEVERILFTMLGPRPSESLRAIDEILAEDDSGD
jgi:hypothetical protein